MELPSCYNRQSKGEKLLLSFQRQGIRNKSLLQRSQQLKAQKLQEKGNQQIYQDRQKVQQNKSDEYQSQKSQNGYSKYSQLQKIYNMFNYKEKGYQKDSQYAHDDEELQNSKNRKYLSNRNQKQRINYHENIINNNAMAPFNRQSKIKAQTQTSTSKESQASLYKDVDVQVSWVQKFIKNATKGGRTQGLILANLLTFIMSTNWVVVKEGAKIFDPLSFTSIRFLVAALGFVPFMGGKFKSLFQNPTLRNAGVELGIYSALGYVAQAEGLQSTLASRASFLSTFTVILVPIFAGLQGAQVKKLTWVCAALAILGVGLLENGGAPPSIGDLWSFASAAFFAFQVVRTGQISQTLTKDQTIQLLFISVLLVFSSTTLISYAMHPEYIGNTIDQLKDLFGSYLTHKQQVEIEQFAYTGFISTDLVLVLEIFALKDITSVDAALIYSLEPVLGAMFAYILLGERWTQLGWVGAGVILSSSLLVQLSGGSTVEDPEKNKPEQISDKKHSK